ncbi:Hypothetical protein Bdt_0234 [Bdellovibrio bacteriovorus str. Tiberius]|uniref:Uncharacterized protein n=2 Tax=Bdellovibrio bacteriovorus TaxID=959 RepID=K7YQZ1_BDEBC|nr:Hypothetical protein Bdt_0234 [Bdellovibrio bacteriovorus str. Tiberius]
MCSLHTIVHTILCKCINKFRSPRTNMIGIVPNKVALDAMKIYLKKCKSYALCMGSSASEGVTELTKGIRFTANAVSQTMDTMNGGILKHGGFHRLYGGHSIVDSDLWGRFGFRFAREVGKDSLTTNGIPLPGVQTAVTKNLISPKIAQNLGSLNIGDFLASGIAMIDTGVSAHRFIKDRASFLESSNRVLIKGTIKIATASFHGNLPLMALGTCDLAMYGYSKIEKRAEIDFELAPHFFPFAFSR